MGIKFSIIFIFLLCIVFSQVIAIGNLLLNSGPSCSISTLIPGIPNQTVNTMKGTCYSSLICRQQGGVPIGRCGVSNVCCVFPRTCGGIAAQNSTYFTNPGFPSFYNNTNTCSLIVHRIPGVNRICQIRLDFVDFELLKPIDGKCSDRFTVTGQNLNSNVPELCGFNSRQHLYIDVDGLQGPIFLTVQTDGKGDRRWNILVSQIECINPSKAPPNCLQYYFVPNGEIMSFNYDDEQSSELNSTPSPTTFGYINGLDYSICFRKEQYFCSQNYTLYDIHNDQSFGIKGIQEVADGTAGAGVTKCPTDYLQLNGIRFCGNKLNIKGFDKDIKDSEPVNDSNSGPFIARFVSNANDNGRGFKIKFRQNPCKNAVMQQYIPSQPTGGRNELPLNSSNINSETTNAIHIIDT